MESIHHFDSLVPLALTLAAAIFLGLAQTIPLMGLSVLGLTASTIIFGTGQVPNKAGCISATRHSPPWVMATSCRSIPLPVRWPCRWP